MFLHDKDSPATIVLQSFNSLHDYHCNVGYATMDLNHTHRPLVEQCCLMFLHDKDSPATIDHYGQTVDDQIVLQSFNSLHDYHCNVGCATMHLPL